jgi:hypothetical protein
MKCLRCDDTGWGLREASHTYGGAGDPAAMKHAESVRARRRSFSNSVRWWLSPSKGVGSLVVTAAAAEEHERHQPAPDQQGEECP